MISIKANHYFIPLRLFVVEKKVNILITLKWMLMPDCYFEVIFINITRLALNELLIIFISESLYTMHIICIVFHCLMFKILHIPRTTQVNDK